MKENITIQTTKCDFCGHGSNVYQKCLGCIKDVCYECTKNRGIMFPHAVHFGGSYDGFYCSECLGNPKITSTNLYKAYKLVLDLRNEYKTWWKDFDLRGNKADEELKKLINN